MKKNVRKMLCDICSNEFLSKIHNAKYCGKECTRVALIKKVKSGRINNPIRYKLYSLNKMNRSLGVCELKLDDFSIWYNKDKSCEYCGITEFEYILINNSFGNNKFLTQFNKNMFHIDRKIPSIGYTIDNICFSCARCNLVKGDLVDYHLMKKFGELLAIKDSINLELVNSNKNPVDNHCDTSNLFNKLFIFFDNGEKLLPINKDIITKIRKTVLHGEFLH